MSKKIVLVTGGNNGIGLETCSQLAEQPDTHVIMASRSIEKGQKALETVRARAPNASIDLVQLDITSDSSIEAAVKQVTDTYGHIDTLINNAGICPVDISRDLFREAFETNATSPALVTRAFAPLLRKSRSPRLIYVTSRLGSCGERADPNIGHYDEDWKVYRMTKAAVNMLALCDAWEYKNDGVLVFDYCPGFVTSDLAGMRQQKEEWNIPGPEKSAAGLVAIHQGNRDAEAGEYLNSGSDQGVGRTHPW